MGVSGEVSVTADTAKSVRNMASNTFELKKEVSVTANCDKGDPETEASLY